MSVISQGCIRLPIISHISALSVPAVQHLVILFYTLVVVCTVQANMLVGAFGKRAGCFWRSISWFGVSENMWAYKMLGLGLLVLIWLPVDGLMVLWLAAQLLIF